MQQPQTHNAFKGYIPALDGVRAYAVFIVMLHHLFVSHYFEYGWVGVQVFFVLSGFLITSILLESKTSENYFQVFYMRRVLRIFPLYYLTLLLVLLYSIFSNININDVYQYIFYVQNYQIGWNDKSIEFPKMFNHTWSLAVEEQFYMVWPLLIWLVPQRHLGKLLVPSIALSVIFKIVFYYMYPDNRFNYMNTLSNLDSLAAGAFISVAVLTMDYKKLIKGLVIFNIINTGLYIAACLVLDRPFFWSHIAEIASLDWLLFYFWLIPIVVLFIVYLIGHTNNFVKTFFCNPVLLYLGKISYGIYLYHYIIYGMIDNHSEVFEGIHPMIPMSVYKIIISILVAIVSWYIFESPMLKLKRYFNYSKTKTTSTSSLAIPS